MAATESKRETPKLIAQDLRECARHYRWAKRSATSLLATFPDDRPLDAAGLARIDAWVPRDPTENPQRGPKPAFDSLAIRPAGPRILAVMNVATLGELRKSLQTGSTRAFVTKLIGASTQRPNVPEELAFPLTVLLRCLVPTRFPILTRPLEIAAVMVPVEIRRRGIRARRRLPSAGPRGSGWPWAWPTHEDFVVDYLAYATWHRTIARRVGIAEPGVIDDGCWQLSRCLERQHCPAKGSDGGLCPTGMKVLNHGGLRTELGVPGEALQIFHNILKSFGEEPLSEMTWDDVASMLLPEPEVVRRLFARARETAPQRTGKHAARGSRGRKGSTVLRGLERAFGEHLVRVLVEANPLLKEHPSELGRRLATHGTVIKRYLDGIKSRPA